MRLILTALPLFLLSPVTVTPPTTPAKGKQEAIVRIDKPGMYRVTATSPEGTACEIVDHLRGPFQRSGISGKENCRMDLLLDAGVYKLRMQSPKKGKGVTRVEAQPFEEINAKPVRLVRGRFDQRELREGQQASYWIRVQERRYVLLRVLGRTAGEVRLWRDGDWVEEIESRRDEFMHLPGQPLHEWQVGGMLEKGDYLLTVYGASPLKWTKGKGKDFLFVANGFEKGPQDGSLVFTLPAWGKVSYEVPKGRLVGFLSLDRAASRDTFMQMQSLPDKAGDRLGSPAGRCTIFPKALIPICSAWSHDDQRNLLTISGPPGTSGELRWARYNDSHNMADGDYGRVRDTLSFEAPESGDYLVSSHDVPVDTDAAPLSCQLTTRRYRQDVVLGRDFLRLSPDRAYHQQFNYPGREETVWFEATKAGVYQVATAGERKNRCVLYALSGSQRTLVKDTDPAATECNIVKHLSKGFYELKIYGGNQGIERLKIACLMERPFPSKTGPGDNLPVGKSSCLIPKVTLQEEEKVHLGLNRSGSATARGLVLRKLPLTLQRPLPLVLDAGQKVELPVAAGGLLTVRSAGGGDFTCALGNGKKVKARDGICRLPVSQGSTRLVLSNPGKEVLAISAHRPGKPRPVEALPNYSPVIPPLPKLSVDRPRFFDFERGQSHSMIFDVKKPGLYHVTTRGLLHTECRMRTAIVSRLVADTGSGRGRNCLVSQFLNPGRYLLTVKTVGQSRGRSSVLVTERPVRKGRKVKPGKETFFRTGADELIRQELSIPRTGKYQVQTSGQVVSLQCRLDDHEGWPVVRVPTACNLTYKLFKGKYLWTQLPITVPSMRRTRLERVKKPLVLKGEKPHTVALNKSYRVRLGADGKDEFRFRLLADLEVFFGINNGMQGRVYRLADQGKEELIEPVPPDAGSVAMKLKAGGYKFVTEHSRADVGILYNLYLGCSVLAPGVSREVPVPSEATVRMPASGVLRLKTTGQVDVRCRMFDADGVLVAESGSHGADWNCLIATPLVAGDYRLVLEAENTIGGNTQVSAVSTETRDIGVLEKDGTFETGGKVLLARTAAPAAGTLQEFSFRSKLTFSWALEDDQGRAVESAEGVRNCRILLHPKGKQYGIRLWSKNWYAKIRASVSTRRISPLGGGSLSGGQAVLATVPRAGHYTTGPGVFCIRESESGLLLPCYPAASLETGAWIFSGTGKKSSRLDLAEQVAGLDGSAPKARTLSSRPHIQRMRSNRSSLHLLKVALPFGEPVSPACRVDGGIHTVDRHQCFAAAGPGQTSTMRWWVPGRKNRSGLVDAEAAPVPDRSDPLGPGIRELVWRGPVARFSLPATPSRIELALPADGWAVQTGSDGKVVDMCPPRGKLSHCPLRGHGGELFVVSNAERRARVQVVLDRSEVPGRVLRKVAEGRPRGPGRVELEMPAEPVERRFEVTGAKRCTVHFEDGTRLAGCKGTVAAGQSARAWILHDGDPWRAVLAQEGQWLSAVWGASLPAVPGSALPPSQAAVLDGEGTHRSLVIQEPAVVQMLADTGVCALADAKGLVEVDGSGRGCRITRLLDPGTYRFLVRSFASERLTGSMSWLASPVQNLNEGIGPEEWMTPGEVRTFRFTTRSAGSVGIGLRVDADVLTCTTLDPSNQVVGEGCLQFVELKQGTYLLKIAAPRFGDPVRFRPVILGLSGSKMDVPEDYLRDFFRRIGERP